MPELDYAILCDFVRSDSNLHHIIGAGIDTYTVPQVPSGVVVCVALRVLFARNECERPHRVELIIQREDGEHIAEVSGTITPSWREGNPPGWPVGAIADLRIPAMFPASELYSVDVLINDQLVKTVPFRVLEAQQAPE